MKRTTLLCLGALAFCIALPLMAQSPPAGEQQANASTLTQEQIHSVEDMATLYKLAATYQENADMQRMSWTLEQLSLVLPMSGEIRLALAAAYSNLDEKSKAYDTLLRMQSQGFGYNLTKDERFKKIADTEVWEYVVANLRANLKPFGEGRNAFVLPKGEYLFESMAWDAQRQRFVLGSAREGTIYLGDRQGKLEAFITPNAENGLWSTYALAVDADRDLLYVASNGSTYLKELKAEDVGKAGIFKFQLSTGKFLDKFVLPAAEQGGNTLSSIAVSSKGQVFAADGLRNIIYRLDGKTLKVLMPPNPITTSVRGIAVSGDGNTLFFADYARGVFGIDLKSSKPFDIEYDRSQLVLPGIDGLYWYDNTLVAIEPGMSPKRIIRLHLSKDGRKIERVMPLDAGANAYPYPSSGAVVGDALYFFADSHRDFYDSYGVPKNEFAASPQHVFRSNLRFAWKETMDRPALGEKSVGGPQIIGADQQRGDPRKLLNKKVDDFGRGNDARPVDKPAADKK
ncbi:MAG: hypothetical protein ABIR16_06470 [Dokdonella sp.]